MPRIKILAKVWPQHIDGNRYERRTDDVVEASEADAARLIKAGAAEPTKRKINVPDQKDTAEEVAPKPAEDTPTPDEEPAPGEFELLPADQIDLPMPSQAATTELWQDYAIAAGMPESIARTKKRDELRQLFA